MLQVGQVEFNWLIISFLFCITVYWGKVYFKKIALSLSSWKKHLSYDGLRCLVWLLRYSKSFKECLFLEGYDLDNRINIKTFMWSRLEDRRKIAAFVTRSSPNEDSKITEKKTKTRSLTFRSYNKMWLHNMC